MAADTDLAGQPQADQERNEAKLTRWNHAIAPFIVVAALLPLLMAFARSEEGDDPTVWIDLAAWAIFAADLGMHMWLRPGYLRTRNGKIDLAIVVITLPWYALPGLEAGAIVTVARLARVARLAKLTQNADALKRVAIRLGKTGVVAAILIVCCAAVVNAVESPEIGFVTFGDSVWWGLVTLTTVGYGDIVPETGVGRASATILMIGGVGILGLLAGSLAEFFESDEPTDEEPQPLDTASVKADQVLAEEIRSLRGEITKMRDELGHPG